MIVRQLMKQQACTIEQECSVHEAGRIMRDQNVGSLVVLDNKKVVGIITDRDIATSIVAEGADINERKVKEYMSGDLRYCYDFDPLSLATNIMVQAGVRRLPVFNNKRELVGFISLTDFIESSVGEQLMVDTFRRMQRSKYSFQEAR